MPLGEEAAHWVARYLREARPELARGAEDALFLSARGRRLDTSTLRRLTAAPAPPAPRVRDAPARGRRRPARDPGAARPLVPLDDADLQPRRRESDSAVSTTERTRDPERELEGFLALLAARRAPAHRRRLPPRPRRARAPSSASRSRRDASTTSSATSAQLRADGLSPRRIARRTAAARTFFRHLQLIGARGDNPAAELDAAAADADAAAHALAGRGRAADRRRERRHAARAARPRARRAALRRGPARLGGGRAREGRRRPRRPARTRHRQGRQGARRPARPRRRSRRCGATSRRGRPHLDRRHRPELFLNAKGGALTRAGAFLILRRLAAERGPRAGARPPAPAAPLVRDAPARGRRRPAKRAGDARPRRPRARPSSTRTSPIAAGASCTSRRTRTHVGAPAGVSIRRRKPICAGYSLGTTEPGNRTSGLRTLVHTKALPPQTSTPITNRRPRIHATDGKLVRGTFRT